MKTNLRFIGIDVSKDTLDVGIYSEEEKSTVIKNSKKAILKYFNKLLLDKGVIIFVLKIQVNILGY